MQSQSNSLIVLNCSLYRDRWFINIMTSPINKPTFFFNFLSQLNLLRAQRDFIDLHAR